MQIDELGAVRIPIGKVTKLSFQRVLICHVWISYEGVASVLKFRTPVCPSWQRSDFPCTRIGRIGVLSELRESSKVGLYCLISGLLQRRSRGVGVLLFYVFPATVCPSSIGVLQLHVFLAIGLAELIWLHPDLFV